MKTSETPEFYTGAPVDPVDLRFRSAFLAELWQSLSTNHVVLTAPRRTGKTSVMDYLRQHPQNGYSVASINVQDLTHPADFFQALLDALHDAHPHFVRDQLAEGWSLLSGILSKISEVEVGGFKLALRGSDPNWRDNWRQHGDQFLAQARRTSIPILFIIDEFPDMLLKLAREDEALLGEFLGWFRAQRLSPAPSRDSIRWLIGGSVNLAGTLDSLGMVDLINDIEDVPLPPLTDDDIRAFVEDMLGGRGVPFDGNVARRVIERLGRPIPLFMQLATQDLYRLWKKEQRQLTAEDVDNVFDSLVVSSSARTRLQHFYSRIGQYYPEPKRSAAYGLLSKISVSEAGLKRETLLQETERLQLEQGIQRPAHGSKRTFNQLLLDLENDFYVVEVAEGSYDFACGVLKLWWRKYYA